jgi:hypothetical protein
MENEEIEVQNQQKERQYSVYSKGGQSDSFEKQSDHPEEQKQYPKPIDPSSNNLDDIPIPVSKPKTFEELLEEEISKGNAGAVVEEKKTPSKH